MATARWNGVVLAESDHCRMVEGNYYFPPDSIHREYLKPSRTRSLCFWRRVRSVLVSLNLSRLSVAYVVISATCRCNVASSISPSTTAWMMPLRSIKIEAGVPLTWYSSLTGDVCVNSRGYAMLVCGSNCMMVLAVSCVSMPKRTNTLWAASSLAYTFCASVTWNWQSRQPVLENMRTTGCPRKSLNCICLPSAVTSEKVGAMLPTCNLTMCDAVEGETVPWLFTGLKSPQAMNTNAPTAAATTRRRPTTFLILRISPFRCENTTSPHEVGKSRLI